ncbi:ATP-binding cassette domain-containing protein [Streptomyces wuyuanensis]|uniref:ABC transporter ATP-binding protein n=1 Tax=Streptomyces wuyuanensis TaxID=1196353 RepID=UPI0038231CFD
MTALLEVRGLWYRYPRDKSHAQAVLRGIDAHIGEGESVGIVGRNGSGKSTLLKVMSNLLRPSQGEIRFGGRPVRLNDHAYRSVLNYCAGAPQGFYPRLTASENLRFFSGMKGRMYTPAEASALLGTVGLGASSDVKYATFSLGMRQRLHLACLLLEPSRIWILDEPTTGLDQEGLEMLEEMLSRAERKTRIVVSHDAALLSRVTSRTLNLQEGVLTCTNSSCS